MFYIVSWCIRGAEIGRLSLVMVGLNCLTGNDLDHMFCIVLFNSWYIIGNNHCATSLGNGEAAAQGPAYLTDMCVCP